jgi:hypothetical protein
MKLRIGFAPGPEPMLRHVRQMLAWRQLVRPRILGRGDRFDYLKLTSRCKTENEFNRVHIKLENILTPAEFAAIAALAKEPNFPGHGRKWVKKILSWTPALVDAPRRFERHAFSDYVLLYQDPLNPRYLLRSLPAICSCLVQSARIPAN